MKNIAIVYHYIAHYRIPIFRLLSKSTIHNYTIYAGLKPDIEIKTAPYNLAKIPVEDGGIRWMKLSNFWIFKIFLWQKGVLNIAFNKKIDTIIFLGNMYYISTWIGAIIGRIAGKKIVFWTHGFLKNEDNFKGFLRTAFYHLPHNVLVYGNRAREIMIRKGFDPSKIDLVYNSLDYDNQIRIKNDNKMEIELKFGNQELPLIGFIGRLTYKKRIDIILSVLYDLKKELKPVNFLVVGSGEAIDNLKNKVLSYGLEENVIFYGACYDEEEIYSLMSKMAVMVSPGEVGLTAIHALTYGLPIITHNNFNFQGPEFEAIIPGETGDFFEKDSMEGLKKYVNTWVFEKNREDFRDRCFEIIEKNYNPYRQVEIFNSIV